jgi:hypothetical protein
MRRIFANVPVIYGFSSLAPLGAVAGPMLGKYFQTAPPGEIGSGRTSASLLRQFAPSSMIAVAGLSEGEQRAASRAEACRFVDQRLTTAQKIESVHTILGGDLGEARMQLDRIEKLATALGPVERSAPDVAEALSLIARDDSTRERYLRFARNTDRPEIRTRMLKLAGSLGWLTPQAERAELAAMIGDELARDRLGFSEVDLICSLNGNRLLDPALAQLRVSPALAARSAHSAVLACLGDPKAHARVLSALVSADDRDVQVAQVYLRHHPITDVVELRTAATGIATQMAGSDAQIRALDTLAFHYVADRESLESLKRLFAQSKSLTVQRAIAGILIRSDYRHLDRQGLVRVLQQHRLKSPNGGSDLIDVLIRRLQAEPGDRQTPA